ncbi:DUF5343 domain-containing protein [Xanthomonas massiliensis]|uniref:DUF5343 domain-containing protein n=1 Tax=Xanthomonas massiliensis TaxID=1720302 RepID=UPI0011CCACE1|nr:DUF5343 domain-containing protein [Xanthomonas massiliensis]
MSEFSYTTVPGKIKPLLEKIRSVGIPKKATVQWLKTIGFTSSNDKTLLGILKTVSLIDASGIPTSTWSAYRGASHRAVLGQTIQTGYAELFAVYADAWDRPNSELEHVFATSTSAGKQVVSKTVASFKALCECADFKSAPGHDSQSVQTTTPLHAPVSEIAETPQGDTSKRTSPSIHIDLQIHVSPEASSDQIDQIFRSMAKHLYGAKDTP